MWTYIKKENYDNFINQYSIFEDFAEELILLETDDAYFLPRLFTKNYPSQYINEFTGGEKDFEPAKIENIEFKGTLRDEQVDIVNELATGYQNNNDVLNGIVKARPGLG